MFSGGPSFFTIHVCNDGALSLHLHVLALPASVTMWWSAKLTWKLNISGLDFLLLVLQKSHSVNLHSESFFFHFLFCLLLPGYKCHIQIMYLGAVCSTGFVWKVENKVSSLFLSEIFKLFPVKTPCFREVLRFLQFMFVMMGLWICACTW